MPNELIPASEENTSLDLFQELTASESQFFSRVQLYSFKANDVADGAIPSNHYGIPSDDGIIDLGDEVDAVILDWRPKALQTGGDVPIECFDPTSPLFQEIQKQSFVRDSGAMFGPEFLLYIPSVSMYVTLFMSSKTSRREARKMEPLLRCAVTLKSKLITSGSYKWQGIVVIECSTPLDLPSIDQIQKKIAQFKNPPKQDLEVDKTESRDR